MLQDIRALASSFVEALFSETSDATGDLVSIDFTWKGPALLGRCDGGIRELIAFSQTLRAALPDFRLSLEEPIVEVKTAVIRWTVRGCHSGTALGGPTKRIVLFTGFHILHFDEQKEVYVKLTRL